MVADELGALVREVAPREDATGPGPDDDLGYGGYRMTLLEYLALRDRVERRWGIRLDDRTWPHRLADLARHLPAEDGGG